MFGVRLRVCHTHKLMAAPTLLGHGGYSRWEFGCMHGPLRAVSLHMCEKFTHWSYALATLELHHW